MEFSQVRIATHAQIHTDFRKKNRKEGYATGARIGWLSIWKKAKNKTWIDVTDKFGKFGAWKSQWPPFPCSCNVSSLQLICEICGYFYTPICLHLLLFFNRKNVPYQKHYRFVAFVLGHIFIKLCRPFILSAEWFGLSWHSTSIGNSTTWKFTRGVIL